MSDPFIGQIGLFSFGYAPRGWAFCNGQLMAIAQNQALFSLLGTTYGGDGVTTFGLPNLQNRAQVSSGQGAGLSSYVLGQVGGEVTHTLTIAEMAPHIHGAATASDTTQLNPQAHYWAPNTGGNNTYSATSSAGMSGAAVGIGGSGQGHANMQPYLALNFCIALQGVYPSRN
jgi:microcystin-dependent protein